MAGENQTLFNLKEKYPTCTMLPRDARSLNGRGLIEGAQPDWLAARTPIAGFGVEFKPRDLGKLKAIASRLPDAVVVISVLRDHFTPREKKILTKFVNWGRRVNVHGEPTNPMLLLTAHELMMGHFISDTWKKLGGAHAKFASYEHVRNLMSFADATQQIYLGMKSFHQVRDEYWKKRLARRQAAKAKES